MSKYLVRPDSSVDAKKAPLMFINIASEFKEVWRVVGRVEDADGEDGFVVIHAGELGWVDSSGSGLNHSRASGWYEDSRIELENFSVPVDWS